MAQAATYSVSPRALSLGQNHRNGTPARRLDGQLYLDDDNVYEEQAIQCTLNGGRGQSFHLQVATQVRDKTCGRDRLNVNRPKKKLSNVIIFRDIHRDLFSTQLSYVQMKVLPVHLNNSIIRELIHMYEPVVVVSCLWQLSGPSSDVLLQGNCVKDTTSHKTGNVRTT